MGLQWRTSTPEETKRVGYPYEIAEVGPFQIEVDQESRDDTYIGIEIFFDGIGGVKMIEMLNDQHGTVEAGKAAAVKWLLDLRDAINVATTPTPTEAT